MSIGKGENRQAVNAQQDNQERLNPVHDKSEYTGIRHIHPVKHHHGNDGKMPRTRSVGGGHNHCKRTAYEHHQGCHHAQMGSKGETIEGEIEMEKVARPYGKCIEYEEGNVAHALQRHDSFPNIKAKTFHFLIEKQRLP